MRWVMVAAVAVMLLFLDLAALHDIFVGEADLRAEYATLACSSLVLAGLLAGALSRAADRRRSAPSADDAES